ncbi:unnamed protein product [Schistosoma curassoni]|uniref:MFS domain-containing protein n=1 Tax=Schistosoma curassoni TaxID=6186 RepID=A0A183JS25_9TREM|nr:unnamed protein product [Schistosoma curassoni]
MYRVLCGAARANVGVVSALVGDISSDTLRTKGMAVVGLAYGIGFTVGPPCSVILLSQWKVHTSTEYLSCMLGSTCLLLNCVNLLILIFALPSTLQKVCFLMLYHISENYSLTDAFVNIKFFYFELNVSLCNSRYALDKYIETEGYTDYASEPNTSHTFMTSVSQLQRRTRHTYASVQVAIPH